MTGSVDPKESIALLNELKRRGFNNDFYRQLHHLENDTISNHIHYCEKISEFRSGETNAVFQLRLRFVRDRMREKYGSEQVVDGVAFQQFVKAALQRYPL